MWHGLAQSFAAWPVSPVLLLTSTRATSHESPVITYCDPAGAGVNDVNGSSAVRELRKFGINCRYRQSSILEGIELIRRALRNGRGESTLDNLTPLQKAHRGPAMLSLPRHHDSRTATTKMASTTTPSTPCAISSSTTQAKAGNLSNGDTEKCYSGL